MSEFINQESCKIPRFFLSSGYDCDRKRIHIDLTFPSL